MLGIDEKFTHTMFDLPYPNLIAGMRCPGGFDGFEDNANDNWLVGFDSKFTLPWTRMNAR